MINASLKRAYLLRWKASSRVTGVNYTLSGASGAYTYTGNSATFKVAHSLSGVTGSYSYTGNIASFKIAHTLSGANGSYIYTGQSATFAIAHKLNGSAGVYTYTGQSATLVPKHNYALSGSFGSYIYIGQNATLIPKHKYVLAGQAGNYSYTGQSATLTYTAGSIAYSLLGNTGSYTFTGNTAVLDYHSNAIVEIVSRGGFKTKSKVKKSERPDVEKAITDAIDKVIGKPIAPIEKEIVRIKPNKSVKTEFIDQINELVLKAEIDLLSAHLEEISRLKEAEIDDEESILLLL